MPKENKILLDLKYNHKIILPADLAVKVMMHAELAKDGEYMADKGAYLLELVDKPIEARTVSGEEYDAAYTRMKLVED